MLETAAFVHPTETVRPSRRRNTPSVPNDHLGSADRRLKKARKEVKSGGRDTKKKRNPPTSNLSIEQGCRFSGRDREWLLVRRRRPSLACVSAYRCLSTCQSILPWAAAALPCPPARLPPIIKCLVSGGGQSGERRRKERAKRVLYQGNLPPLRTKLRPA